MIKCESCKCGYLRLHKAMVDIFIWLCVATEFSPCAVVTNLMCRFQDQLPVRVSHL